MMYLQALVDDWQFPPTDPAVRAKWMAEQDRIGVEALHEVLRSKDPDAADIIEQKDPRRIVRALEVIELTGKPFAASQPPKNVPTRWGTRIFGLNAPGNWLNPRLEARVDRMFAAGLVAEVEGLAAAGLSRESTAGKAIGYAQVLSALAGSAAWNRPGRIRSWEPVAMPAASAAGSAVTRGSTGWMRLAPTLACSPTRSSTSCGETPRASGLRSHNPRCRSRRGYRHQDH